MNLAIAHQLARQGAALAFIGGKRSPLVRAPNLWRWVISVPSASDAAIVDEIRQHVGPCVLFVDDVLNSVIEDPIVGLFCTQPGERAVVANLSWNEARYISTRSPFGAALREGATVAYLNPERDNNLRDFQVEVPVGMRLQKTPGRGMLFRSGVPEIFQAVTP